MWDCKIGYLYYYVAVQYSADGKRKDDKCHKAITCPSYFTILVLERGLNNTKWTVLTSDILFFPSFP